MPGTEPMEAQQGDQLEPPVGGVPNPAVPAIYPRHLTLIKLFTSQTSTLPKFKASKGELWRSFETTFRNGPTHLFMNSQCPCRSVLFLVVWKEQLQKLIPYWQKGQMDGE